MSFLAKRLCVNNKTIKINVKLIYQRNRHINTSLLRYQDKGEQENHSDKLDLIESLKRVRLKKAPPRVTTEENIKVIDSRTEPSVNSYRLNHDKCKRTSNLKLIEDLPNPPKKAPPRVTTEENTKVINNRTKPSVNSYRLNHDKCKRTSNSKLIEDLQNPPTKDIPPPITARRWIENVTIINDNFLGTIGSDERSLGSNVDKDKQKSLTYDATPPPTDNPGTDYSQENKIPFQLEDGQNFLSVIESSYNNHTSFSDEKSFVSNINTSIPSAAYKLMKFFETGDIKVLSLHENYEDITLKEIDQICCSWFDNLADLDFEETNKRAFSIASIWAQTENILKTANSSNRKGMRKLESTRRSVNYLKRFLDHFLSNSKLNLLNSQELVFCMHLVRLMKYYPNVEQLAIDSRLGPKVKKLKKNKEYFLNENLEKLLLHHLPTLTISDIGMIMESLYTSRVFLGREHHKLKESLLSVLLKLDDKNIKSHPREVTNIFKILTTRDYTIPLDQMNQLMQKYVPLMPTFNLFLLLRSAEFFSDAFPDKREYLLKTYIHCIERHLVDCRMKDIHSIAEVLSKLNYEKGINEPFMMKFVEAGNSVKSNELQPLKNWVNNAVQFIFFNTCLTNMGYFCIEYLNRIFEVVNNSPKLDASETTEEILRNAVTSISCIGDETLRNCFNSVSFQKMVNKAVSNDAALMRGAISKIFYLDCMIEICVPQYKGIRLKESLRQKLSKLVVREVDYGMNYFILNTVIDNVCSALNIRSARSNDYLYLGHLSPESTSYEISFCIDVESSKRSLIKVMPLPKRYVRALDQCIHVVRPEDYSDFEEQSSDLSMSKKFRWIAICAPQNKNYRRRKKTGELEIIPCQVGSGDFYTKNVGPFNVRVQKLEALGYTVIPLTYDLLDKCVDQRKIREIRTLINKYCVA